jgi:hypothetical protein
VFLGKIGSMEKSKTPLELIELYIETRKTTGKKPSRDEMQKACPGFKWYCDQHFGSYSKFVDAVQKYAEPQEITAPLIPSDDIDIKEIIDGMCKRFNKRINAHESKKWMEFQVNHSDPIGINFFGDPHLDDDGCNWPLLKEHIEVCKNTPGMFGANIGDTHNNWVGRLMKEYASQETSRSTAFKLIEWFFHDSGVKWLLILAGNHDGWNFGSETMSRITKNICPMIDWRAQFKLKFKNGAEFLVDAAHDHNGHSQWNSLHGQQKASTMGGIAHLYIAGHKHNWALAQNECPHTSRIYWLARARGYKYIDSYAENLGFGSQKFGASITVIIDPKANDVNRVRCFADPKEGAEYLNFLRSRK